MNKYWQLSTKKIIVVAVLIAFAFFCFGMMYGSYKASKWLISTGFEFFNIELDEEEFYYMVTNYKGHIAKCYPNIELKGG